MTAETGQLLTRDHQGFVAIGSTTTRCAAATRLLAERVAPHLPPGTLVALSGHLGAGKTQFAKGLAAALTGTPEASVRSPTFTLLHTYRSRPDSPVVRLHHMDVCRVTTEADLPPEIHEAIADQQAVTVMEWAEAFPVLWPERVLLVEISHDATETDLRHFALYSRGLNTALVAAAVQASQGGPEAPLK